MMDTLPISEQMLRSIVPAGTDRAILIDSSSIFAGVKLYEPDEDFANHYHDGYDEYFAVLEGEISVWVGQAVKTVLGAGESLLCRRGEQHYLRNESDQITRLFYAKVPMIADDSVPVAWTPERSHA